MPVCDITRTQYRWTHTPVTTIPTMQHCSNSGPSALERPRPSRFGSAVTPLLLSPLSCQVSTKIWRYCDLPNCWLNGCNATQLCVSLFLKEFLCFLPQFCVCQGSHNINACSWLPSILWGFCWERGPYSKCNRALLGTRVLFGTQP